MPIWRPRRTSHLQPIILSPDYATRTCTFAGDPSVTPNGHLVLTNGVSRVYIDLEIRDPHYTFDQNNPISIAVAQQYKTMSSSQSIPLPINFKITSISNRRIEFYDDSSGNGQLFYYTINLIFNGNAAFSVDPIIINN
jgi:hypothetical protein